MVLDFANSNFLKLNIQKCDFIPFSLVNGHVEMPHCMVDSTVLPVVASAKCVNVLTMLNNTN